jgi:hypothetical protein
MTDDMAVYGELGYLQAVLADVVMLVEDQDLDDVQLRRELRRVWAQIMNRPGVADVVARRRGGQS